MYHVAAIERGDNVRLSEDYFIEARKDTPPVVKLVRPGRDAKVNPIEEVAVEKPKSREVLLRTAFAGLCHSDLHFIEGLYPTPTPVVLGHESACVVEAVGDGVSYVKPGDHVITCLSVFCGTCSQCLTGHPNLCENTEVKMLPGVAKRMTWKGQQMNQAFNLSSFAEQMLVHENSMVKIDDDIPLDRAALLASHDSVGDTRVTRGELARDGVGFLGVAFSRRVDGPQQRVGYALERGRHHDASFVGRLRQQRPDMRDSGGAGERGSAELVDGDRMCG